jgi:isocitrate dehydrogenase
VAVSLAFYGEKNNNSRALVLASALDDATEKFLDNDKSPSRVVGELDTRGSHFFLALYWAQALASQERDAELQKVFRKIATDLTTNTEAILDELNAAQGSEQEIGGYYLPDGDLMANAMRPSPTFNDILAQI